jgi:hypothetical protein
MFYSLSGMLSMLIGILFTISSSLSMNGAALNDNYPSDLYRFHEANFFVGVSFFLIGFFITLTPIVISWYQTTLNRIDESGDKADLATPTGEALKG